MPANRLEKHNNKDIADFNPQKIGQRKGPIEVDGRAFHDLEIT